MAVTDRRLHLVVNPSSGAGRAGRTAPRAAGELQRALVGSEVVVHESNSYHHAADLCQRAVADGATDLVVMGGDGMAHLGLNACAGTEVLLGVVPAGTGNDFCRGAGAATSMRSAVQAIGIGRTRRIDLAQASGELAGGAQRRWVGSILSTGYDARVNRRTNQVSLPLGPLSPLAYAGVALAELATFEPMDYRLRIDGVERTMGAMFVAVGNAGYFGGGMHICPHADVTDGLLEVMLINPVSRATLLRLLPSAFTGGYIKDPAVEHLRAREVVVDGTDHDGAPLFAMADGEELGRVPVTMTCVPGALSLYVP